MLKSMPLPRQLPSPIGRANKLGLLLPRQTGGEYGLQIKRDFSHPLASVWHLITEPEGLAEWAPFDAHQSLDGAVGQAIILIMAAGGTGTEAASEDSALDLLESEILRCEPPHHLAYNWGSDRLQFDLIGVRDDLTSLCLTQMVTEPELIAHNAAGWHICLDVAALALAGESAGRVVGRDALRFGFANLCAAYQHRFQSEVNDAAF
ncbi:MAG: SRPBCC domain-containing protein [Candidatus Symbiobacter sp.]|nr:SRPBCC domain-containing protein [Candidatus Symbiobacter sp.]